MTDLNGIMASSAVEGYNTGYEFGRNEERQRWESWLNRVRTMNETKSMDFIEGYLAGMEEVLDAVRFVTFEYHDLEVAAIRDLTEELADRAKSYHFNTDFTAPEKGKVASDD